jgi:hypothetical protein
VQVTRALDLDESPGTAQGGDPRLVSNAESVSVRPVIQGSIPTDNPALPASPMAVPLTRTPGAPGRLEHPATRQTKPQMLFQKDLAAGG